MITPARLRQARELRGLTQTALARQVHVHPSAIAQLETGRIQPSPPVLDAIGRVTGFPLTFFTRPSGPPLPPGSLRFRARAAMTARQRRQAWWYAQTLYELMASLAAQTEYPGPRLPRLDGDPVAAAALTRQALGLAPDRPVGPLLRTLRRFSVAHELGHLVLHQVPEGAPHALERQADAFAEAFLLPKAAMREAFVPPITLTTLADLKARWGVSLQALIRRALTLETISPSQYRSLSAQLGARGWRTQEPITVPVERPRALRQLAELLYGVTIDYPALAHDAGLGPAFVRALLEAHVAGGEGARTGAPGHSGC